MGAERPATIRAMPRETALEPDNRAQCWFQLRERAIASLAERQHGVVARSQLLDLGFHRSAIGRRLATGRLHELNSGVYAVGHARPSREGRWLAAVLAAGGGAALS